MSGAYGHVSSFNPSTHFAGDYEFTQALLEGMDEQQRSRIQIPIEMQSLQESAEAFFQKEIECRKDCLSYDHFLKSRVYVVYIREGAACMEDCTNPFYQLLKRKYRCLLVQEVDK